MFDGIPEARNESDQDCIESVFKVLETEIKIVNAKEIKMEQCHILQIPWSKCEHDSKTDSVKPKPTIVKCLCYPDRESIWKARSSLKGAQYWLSKEFPQENGKRRQLLNSIRKKAIQENMKANLSFDKLYIEGQMYSVDTIHKLPDWLKLQQRDQICTQFSILILEVVSAFTFIKFSF